MKKKIIISSIIFLSVISVAIIVFFIYISQLSYGGKVYTIDASKLDTVAYEEEKTITFKIEHKKHESVITYYNVYKNEDNEFILKDNTSYMILENLDVYFSYNNYELLVKNYEDLSVLNNYKREDENTYSVCCGPNDNKCILSLNEDDLSTDINVGIIKTWY